MWTSIVHVFVFGINVLTKWKYILYSFNCDVKILDVPDDDEKKTDLMEQEAKLLQFWYDIGNIVSTSVTGSMLKDMAQLEFTVDILLPDVDSEESKVFYF